MKRTYRFALPLLIVLLLSACSISAPSPSSSPLPAISPLNSPLPASTAVSAVPFQIARSLKPGDTVVRGTGPAGVPVYITDITFMGEPLGTGIVGADGKFSINVRPLPDEHRIGLALGILEGTRWKPEDFYQPEFNGPEAMQVPQVGFFHDTVMVDQP
jgi:hypothetical protein